MTSARSIPFGRISLFLACALLPVLVTAEAQTQAGAVENPAPLEATARPSAPIVPTEERRGTAEDGALAQGGVPSDHLDPPDQRRRAGRSYLPLAGVLGLLAAFGVSLAGIAGMLRAGRKG